MTKRLRVLHIEDSRQDAELVAAALEADGLDAEILWVACPDSLEVTLTLQSFDIVISDYNLPDISGLDVLAIVRRHSPGVPFLVVTGSLGEERAIETLRAGATDFVLKHRLEMIGPAVRRAIDEVRLRKERESAVDSLQRSETELRAVFDSSPIGMVLASEDLLIRRCNASFCAMVGYTEAELRGRSLIELTHPEDREEARGYADRVFKGERVKGYEKRYVRKDGGIVYVRRTATLVRGPGGGIRYALGMIEDITERKLAEAARRELENQLQQAQKMETLGQFTGGIAHDFNNILSVIMTSCELVKNTLAEENAEAACDLDQALAAAGRGRTMISKLMAFSRRDPLDMKVLDPAPMLKEIAGTLRSMLPASVAVSSRIADGLPAVRADDVALSQVIMNLATNARDAMPHGGTFEVSAAREAVEQERASVHGAGGGGYVRITARDTGTGMDEETRRRVFEPLFTTKPEGRGTGLGMSMVFGIIRQHGGFVELWSRPGEGTRVDVFLPEASGASGAKPVSTSVPAAAAGPSAATILVVDDEPSLRRNACRVLERQRYMVIEASGGEEALRFFRERRGAVDLVITDHHMPGFGGLELVRALKEIRPDVRVLVVTGDTAGWTDTEPVLGKLSKPWTIEELITAVRMALDDSGANSVDSPSARP